MCGVYSKGGRAQQRGGKTIFKSPRAWYNQTCNNPNRDAATRSTIIKLEKMFSGKINSTNGGGEFDVKKSGLNVRHILAATKVGAKNWRMGG